MKRCSRVLQGRKIKWQILNNKTPYISRKAKRPPWCNFLNSKHWRLIRNILVHQKTLKKKSPSCQNECTCSFTNLVCCKPNLHSFQPKEKHFARLLELTASKTKIVGWNSKRNRNPDRKPSSVWRIFREALYQSSQIYL